MLLFTRRPNRGSTIRTGTARRFSGWLTLPVLTAGIAGCGIGVTPPETTSAPEGSALPAQTAAADAPAGAIDEDGPSPRANENPGIMVTPAGGGGVVVGDPLEGGRAGAAGPAVAPVAATAVAQATAPAATPEQAAGAPQERRRSKKGREEDEEEAAPVAAAAAPAATPAAAVIPGLGSEPGDEPPPDARPNLQNTSPGAPAGATAEDGSGFQTKRQEAEADAARSAAAAADAAARAEASATAAEDGRVEDVDSVPATVQPNSNASLERGLGGGRKGKEEDGDESFAPGVAAGQPAGEIAIKRGSADEVTESFFSLLAAGQVEKVVPLIAGRATGVLGRLRDGTATPEEIEELKGLAMVRQQENSRPKGGMHRLLTFRADKKMLLVEAEQKEENSTVVKLDIRDAPRRRK